MFAKCRRTASTTFTSTRRIRQISSTSHLTPAKFDLVRRHAKFKSRLPSRPTIHNPPLSQALQPRIHRSGSSTWVALGDNDHQTCLHRGSVLNVVSWNIGSFTPGAAERASAASGHLEELFGPSPGSLVVMLQEVNHGFLDAILKSQCVQRNFGFSNVVSSISLYTDVLGESFVMTIPRWVATRYFTVMMISRYQGTVNCFRLHFVTSMGRDALFVDIPIFTSNGITGSKESLRLCTTHLESLWCGRAYRSGQLAMISALFGGPLAVRSGIIGRLVGGNRNAIDQSEHVLHKASDIDLKAIRGHLPALPVPVLKPFQKDTSYRRARGNTWGFQWKSSRTRKRMDTCFYIGLVITDTLTESHREIRAYRYEVKDGGGSLGSRNGQIVFRAGKTGGKAVKGILLPRPSKTTWSRNAG